MADSTCAPTFSTFAMTSPTPPKVPWWCPRSSAIRRRCGTGSWGPRGPRTSPSSRLRTAPWAAPCSRPRSCRGYSASCRRWCRYTPGSRLPCFPPGAGATRRRRPSPASRTAVTIVQTTRSREPKGFIQFSSWEPFHAILSDCSRLSMYKMTGCPHTGPPRQNRRPLTWLSPPGYTPDENECEARPAACPAPSGRSCVSFF